MALQTALLQLGTPVQGTLSGTWGDTVNNAITEYTDIAIAGTLTLTGDGAVTLANTLGSSFASLIVSTLAGAGTVTAQFAVVRVSGTSVTKVVTGPSYSKTYVVDNASSFNVTFKAASQTGITVTAAEKCTVYYNGTDYVKVGSNFVSGVLPVASGGTSLATLTANNVVIGNGTSAPLFVAPSTSGNVLTSNGTTWASSLPAAGGISYTAVKTANYSAVNNDGVLTNTTGGGFTVTFPASPSVGNQILVVDAFSQWGNFPVIVDPTGSQRIAGGTLGDTLTLDITGATVTFVYTGSSYGWSVFAQVGGNGGTAVTLTGVQTLTNKTIAFGSNTLTDVASLATSQTLTNKTIAFGSNTLSDVTSLSTVQTFTGTKSFTGTSSTLAMILNDTAEVATVSATAATGTINYDITTQAVLYFTTNASANFTVNFRASSGTSLNTAMTTGQSVTAAFLVTNGATAYYNNVVQVDGTTVTPKYQGGTAYAAGNASSIDVYMYTIIKTGSAAFTVFTSQTKFA